MQTETTTLDPSLVPPRRLGKILSQARSDRGLTLSDVADRTAGTFSHAAVSSIERGTRQVTDEELSALSGLYGVTTSSLIPTRSELMIDLSEGEMCVNSSSTTFSDHGEVLSQYLAMVYAMRNIQPGTEIPLRVEDLEVLGKALHLGSSSLRSDLNALMSEDVAALDWRTRLLRKRVLLPAAGVLVALCGAGALILVQGNSTPEVVAKTAPAAVVPATVAPAEIGGAVTQERQADGSAGPVVAAEGGAGSTEATTPDSTSTSTSTSTSVPTASAGAGDAVVGPSSVEVR